MLSLYLSNTSFFSFFCLLLYSNENLNLIILLPDSPCSFRLSGEIAVGREYKTLKGTQPYGEHRFVRKEFKLAHILGILLKNSFNTDIYIYFFSNYYNLQSVHFELKRKFYYKRSGSASHKLRPALNLNY